MLLACRICDNSTNNKIHRAREMMFGLRDEFDYLECGECGTVQIVEVPDLSRYYPKNYYSFSADVDFPISYRRMFEARVTAKYILNRRNPFGKYLFTRQKRMARLFPAFLIYPNLKLNFHTKFLDYGCGNGLLLRRLHYFGFRNLTGADAFIETDIFYSNGIRIYKRDLADFIPSSFDIIMLHHVFEHLPNPRAALREVFRLLKPQSFAIIRLPVIAFAWRHYGVNWVQLDPPRHLFLYPEKTFRKLAEETGFIVEDVTYDSQAFQFLGSELYRRDIPLSDKTAYNGNIEESIFTAEQLDEWESRTVELNKIKDSDQACFYLRKP